MKKLFQICTLQTTHQRFREGELIEEWYGKYPNLFFPECYNLAKSQGRSKGNHFYEWLSAIIIYNSLGYNVLVEKYYMRNKHPIKYELFKQRCPHDLFEYIMIPRTPATQPPDLFCYRNDTHGWFLCEIKGGNDTLKETQKKFFGEIEKLTGREIYLIEIDKKKTFG